VGELYKEQINTAHIPLVEHFALVLGRKRNHSRGVGNGAVSVRAQEKQHMQARLLVKQKRAQALEGEVERLTQATKNQTEAYTQLQADVESQHAEIEIQRKAIEAQSGEMGQKIQDEVQRQVSMIFTNIASGNSFINFQSSAPILMLR
jgi:hypothetical protein